MTNTQISCWYPKQVVTSEQMAVNQYDLYQRIANLIPASTTGTIVELSDITVVGGTISIGAGFFRFPNAVYDFLPEQTVILGGTDSATIPLSDGYLVARSSIFPTIPNQTNYTVGVDYVITKNPNATTDCVIALVVSGLINKFYGTYLINKAANQTETLGGVDTSLAITPKALAWALQNIKVADSKHADSATNATNADHAKAAIDADHATFADNAGSADEVIQDNNSNSRDVLITDFSYQANNIAINSLKGAVIRQPGTTFGSFSAYINITCSNTPLGAYFLPNISDSRLRGLSITGDSSLYCLTSIFAETVTAFRECANALFFVQGFCDFTTRATEGFMNELPALEQIS